MSISIRVEGNLFVLKRKDEKERRSPIGFTYYNILPDGKILFVLGVGIGQEIITSTLSELEDSDGNSFETLEDFISYFEEITEASSSSGLSLEETQILVLEEIENLNETSLLISEQVGVLQDNTVLLPYATQDVVEPDSETTYVGKETNNGEWLIQKIREVGNSTVIVYATVANNETITTYNDAWINRDSLVYSSINNLL
jgi:hypothetical protein